MSHLTDHPLAATLALLPPEKPRLAAEVRRLFELAATAAKGATIASMTTNEIINLQHEVLHELKATPLLHEDDYKALRRWNLDLYGAVAKVERYQRRETPRLLEDARRRCRRVVKAAGNPNAHVARPVDDSALVQLLEGVL